MALFLLAAAAPAAARYASIVVDAETGRVYHGVNADTRNYPASLAKIMTLYMVFEALKEGRLELDQQLVVSRRAAGQAPTRLGVRRGERITVEEAILALVTKSANDVATMAAEALGGTEAKFAAMMTERARDLGMVRTRFRNASGLPNRRQLTTARDMALLARALIRDFPGQYHYFSTKAFRFRDRTHKNHNTLLARYDGTDGIKTGYIRASGFNLVASVKRGDRRLIGVVMGGRTPKSRDRHMAKLLDRAFDKSARIAARRQARKGDSASAAASPRTQRQRAKLPPRPKRHPYRSPIPERAASITATKGASWGIQVGAYNGKRDAELAIRRARSRAPTLLRYAMARVSARQLKAEVLYRARLLGMSERTARHACRVLARKEQSCLPIPPSDRLKVALRSR